MYAFSLLLYSKYLFLGSLNIDLNALTNLDSICLVAVFKLESPT
jgi:hypothetical protein